MKLNRKIEFPDRRRAALRRQLNEAFLGPDGRVSLTKIIAIAAQTGVLYQAMQTWDRLIMSWDVLTVVLVFLIAPDGLKKLVQMKYGTAGKP